MGEQQQPEALRKERVCSKTQFGKPEPCRTCGQPRVGACKDKPPKGGA